MPVMDQNGNFVAPDGTLYRTDIVPQADEVSTGAPPPEVPIDPPLVVEPDPPDPPPPPEKKEETFMIVGKDIEYLGSENDRGSIAIPEGNVLYIVVGTNRMYIYFQNKWKCLNATLESFYDIFNVEIKADGTTKITDVNISDNCTAVFVPDPEVYDLATAPAVKITLDCKEGYVNVKSTCHYPLKGIIQIVNGG